jgi:hypothetical protein
MGCDDQSTYAGEDGVCCEPLCCDNGTLRKVGLFRERFPEPTELHVWSKRVAWPSFGDSGESCRKLGGQGHGGGNE